MNNIMLDASALLAWYQDEPGVEVVDELFDNSHCFMSTINLAEFATKCAENIKSEQEILELIKDLSLQIVDFDEQQAVQTGLLREQTRHLGLSLADRACLVAAKSLQAQAVTADKIWRQLDLDIKVHCIR